MSHEGKETIVVIDDDKSIGKTLKLHFERNGHDVFTSQTAHEGLDTLETLDSAIIILDVRLPDANGVELLREIRERGGNFYSIIITAFPNMETTIAAVQNGVGEYIHKPIDIEEIDEAVEKAGEYFQSMTYEESSYVTVPRIEEIGSRFIGRSQAMKKVFKTVGLVSMSNATAHINGESGTGKELVARAIHQSGVGKNEPFISVNCSAIVDTLLESELFGHEKGSFTGAIAQKDGKFTQAGRGTIFLDEIGEMDINLQAKLLRVLQEREFDRVGGKEKLKCHCRVLSATNRSLDDMVKQGKFREDLYYRLKVINMHIPPLRDRREDIPELVLYFIARTNKEARRGIRHISREAIDLLMIQNWKGNVRQLENVITHAVIMNRGESLTGKDFTSILKPGEAWFEERNSTIRSGASNQPGADYHPRKLAEVEQEQIRLALVHTKWHKGKACEILGVTRPRLDRKIKKYGIKQVRYYVGDGQVPQPGKAS